MKNVSPTSLNRIILTLDQGFWKSHAFFKMKNKNNNYQNRMIVMTFLIQSSHRNLQLYSSGLSDFVVVLGDFEFNLTRFWNSKKPRSSHCGFFLVWCDSSRCVLAAVRRRLKDKKISFVKYP